MIQTQKRYGSDSRKTNIYITTVNININYCIIELQRFVEEVIETIELDDIRDSLVGIPGRSGLSIEQRKRLTIAVELVSNPSIIFMDEPTSGLDARAAAIVMRAVKNVVSTGRTTVCTIHQPSIDVFEAFDEVLQLWNSKIIKYNKCSYAFHSTLAVDSHENRWTDNLFRSDWSSFKQTY